MGHYGCVGHNATSTKASQPYGYGYDLDYPYDPMGDLLMECMYDEEHIDPLEDLLAPLESTPRVRHTATQHTTMTAGMSQHGTGASPAIANTAGNQEMRNDGIFDMPVSAAQPYAYWRSTADGSGVLVIEQAGEPKLVIQVPMDKSAGGVIPKGLGYQALLMLFVLIVIACWKKYSDHE